VLPGVTTARCRQFALQLDLVFHYPEVPPDLVKRPGHPLDLLVEVPSVPDRHRDVHVPPPGREALDQNVVHGVRETTG